jgi:hypothetical protein
MVQVVEYDSKAGEVKVVAGGNPAPAPAAAPSAPAPAAAAPAGNSSPAPFDQGKADAAAKIKADAAKAAADKAAEANLTDAQKAARAEEKKKQEEEEQKTGKGFSWVNLVGPLLAGAASFFMGSFFGMNTILAGLLAAGAAFVIGPQFSKVISGWLGSDGDDKSAQAGGRQRRTENKPQMVMQIDESKLAAAVAQSTDKSRVSIAWQDGSLKLSGVDAATDPKGVYEVQNLKDRVAACGTGKLALTVDANQNLATDCMVPAAVAAARPAARSRG